MKLRKYIAQAMAIGGMSLIALSALSTPAAELPLIESASATATVAG